ncbi:MAG: DUF1846 domain-containing protein [Oscillospiraceae bacterium]|nr:DUF1846 domain-containing protein [Oscillospiraceae bacterium]
MYKTGFDNNKYIEMQSEQIKKRMAHFGGKLYMEFGGKLFDDNHASRVLPGFKPDSKLKMLLSLKDEAEIVIAVSAGAIESRKRRGDLNITYDMEVLRLIDRLRSVGLYVGSVAITMYSHQEAADAFKAKLQSLGIDVYTHYKIDGYPSDVEKIVSADGYGKNEYIKTSRRIVVVTAPGPGSGKMAVCLSQLYHEHLRGINAGYAKFETFPIWNLPLSHPVNLAYEAATADLNDVNMIDPFHLEAYGEATVNYNRDIEIFPVLNTIFERIYGESPYKSPTDMGVNMAGKCIFDNEAVCRAAKQEIIRRYYTALCSMRKGGDCVKEIEKIQLLMNKVGVTKNDRACAVAANKVAEETGAPAAAIELPDGTVLTGKTKSLLGATSALILNALKYLSGIDDELTLIPSSLIEPVQSLKVNYLGSANPRLHIDEILVALSVSAATDKNAEKALKALSQLKGSEAHCSVILCESDSAVFTKLGINLTSEPDYENDNLYHI